MGRPVVAARSRAMDVSHPSSRAALLLEDDAELQHTVARYLQSHGFSVETGVDLESGKALLRQHHFDVVILDPDVDGVDGTAIVRALTDGWTPPLVVVSARKEPEDRIIALELGADDYLTKPFNLRELVARINAVCRRSRDRQTHRSRRARVGNWTVDLASYCMADTAGTVVELTPGEISLLRVFLDHPNRVLIRHELLSLTRKDDGEVFDRTIDVLVSRLRAKLEEDPRHPVFIQTVRGVGYRFTGGVPL